MRPERGVATRAELQAAFRREIGKLTRGVNGRPLAGEERERHERRAWELFAELTGSEAQREGTVNGLGRGDARMD